MDEPCVYGCDNHEPSVLDALTDDEIALLLAGPCEWCGDHGCEEHDPDTGLSQLELAERAEEHAQDRRDERWAEL